MTSHATNASTQFRAGRCLYIAGSDMFNRLNQPAQQLPLYWSAYTEQLDLVGYQRFYSGPPTSAIKRLAQGLRQTMTDRVQITEHEAFRRVAVRKLRMPSLFDALFQDIWILANLRSHLAQSYEVGIVYAPESASLARYLKRSGRVEYLVYHDIDYYPSVSPHHRCIVSRRERSAVRLADAVISVSRPLVALREKQGAKSVLYLPNGVDFAHFSTANNRPSDPPPTLLYVGTLDLRWGIDLPIQAMPLVLKHLPETRLLIAGTGPAEDELKALARKLKLENSVQFLGFVPYKELPSLMAQASVGLATSREDIFRQYASPLKIVEYMAAGLPVICSGGGEAELMIDESGAGLNIPFTPEGCAQAICQLLTTPDDLADRRVAGIKYAQTRTWDCLAEQLAQFLAQRVD